jgi:phage protein D
VIDVSVEQKLGEVAQLTLRITAWDSDTEKLIWVDDAMFKPGSSIEVELGYLNQRRPVFWGEIVGLELDASTAERAVLTVSAYDILHRLGRGQREAKYEDTTYAAIVRKLAQEVYKIGVETEDDLDADPVNPVVVQKDESDLELLSRVAQLIHYDLFADADGKQLVFRKSRLGRSPSLTLDASQDLVQFSARINAADQLGGVEVKALDSNTKQPIRVTLDNPDSLDSAYGPSRTRITAALTTQQLATALAKAELLRIRASFLSAQASCFGRTDLRPGMMIRITGLGARFSGDYYVRTATHALSATAGYRTSVHLEGRPR